MTRSQGNWERGELKNFSTASPLSWVLLKPPFGQYRKFLRIGRHTLHAFDRETQEIQNFTYFCQQVTLPVLIPHQPNARYIWDRVTIKILLSAKKRHCKVNTSCRHFPDFHFKIKKNKETDSLKCFHFRCVSIGVPLK